MSEQEKKIIKKLSSTMPKLNREDQKYVLGVAEGMALAKEHKKENEENDSRRSILH